MNSETPRRQRERSGSVAGPDPRARARVTEVPVLVVGVGPAGLTTAVELARRGVECLLVERRTDLSGLPRATVISTRSMELLRSWGLEDEIRAGGVEVEWKLWVCETLATASAGSALPVGIPTREQCVLLSPTSPTCVPQDHLEPVVLAYLESLRSARVELGTEVVGVDNRPDGVQVTLRRGSTGESRIVHARYVVAGDGAHSTVRPAIGIGMHGDDHLHEAATALFRAPLWELLGDCRYGIYATTHPQGAGTFLPAGPGDRWLCGVEWDPEREELADFTKERFTELIRFGAGAPHLQPRVERIGAFSFTAKLAERFRSESIFLVGDAAHQLTPRGGTGMNTAIHDGYDLGWKLAWVLRGWARAELLDSYESERRPVVEHNLARSADAEGSVRAVESELRVDLGGRVAHVGLPNRPGRDSTLDLLGPGLTLFTGRRRAPWDEAIASIRSPLPLDLHSLDASVARAMGVPGGGALVARPDGMPVGCWPTGTSATPALQGMVRAIAGQDRSAGANIDLADSRDAA